MSLSIIVPVYKVEAYLRQCLSSILDQSYRDIEVIAVDDASPDHSAAILAEYADRDSRLKVVRLERNVGLSGARNVGMDHATGDYVWFVDSDDWLEADAVSHIMARAEQTAAEVVVFNWARAVEGGERTMRDRPLLRSAPDRFELGSWPAILDIPYYPWNKIVHRRLLDRMGYRFAGGWYEGSPFSLPVLAAADSITTLDRFCLSYRIREGSITQTKSDRHLEIFAQWARVYSLINQFAQEPENLQQPLFELMMSHYQYVMDTGRILPKAERPFFTCMRQHFQTYRPNVVRPSSRMASILYPLIERGLFAPYMLLVRLRRVLRR